MQCNKDWFFSSWYFHTIFILENHKQDHSCDISSSSPLKHLSINWNRPVTSIIAEFNNMLKSRSYLRILKNIDLFSTEKYGEHRSVVCNVTTTPQLLSSSLMEFLWVINGYWTSLLWRNGLGNAYFCWCYCCFLLFLFELYIFSAPSSIPF